MSNKTSVNINFLRGLKRISEKNDKLQEFADLAIDWAEQSSRFNSELTVLLKEIANSSPEVDDPRLLFVTVQIDRITWEAIQEIARRPG